MKNRMIKWLVGLVCIGLAFSASATEWTYNSEDSTITDGQWTIIVGKNFKTTQKLTMSQRLVSGSGWKSAISGWIEPDDASKSGVLDLRSPLIVKETDGTETTIQSIEVGQAALSGTGAVAYKMTELYCDIISVLGSYDNNSKQRVGTCFASNTGLTTAKIGGTAEGLPTFLFKDCAALKTLEFKFPNARWAGHSYGQVVITDSSLDPIDVSTIVTPGITNIYKSAFMCSKLYGDVVLTNIMSIGAQAFQGANLTNVYLAGSLTTLQDQAFRGNNTITNVVLDLPKLVSIHNMAFGHSSNWTMQQQKIRRVEFVQAIADMGLVTNIVRYANNSNIGDLRIYVSKKQWDPKKIQEESDGKSIVYDKEANPTGFFSAITDDEKAALDADTQKNVIGVLVKAGTRKGIFIHKPSIHDKPTGFAISVQ